MLGTPRAMLLDEAVPLADPDWNYNTHEGVARCAQFLEAFATE